MTWRRRIAFLILLILFFAISGGYLLVSYIDDLVVQYKPELEAELYELFDREVSLGDIQVRLFPKAFLYIDQIEIEKKTDLDNNLNINSLSITLNLYQLIQGSLKVYEVGFRLSVQQEEFFLTARNIKHHSDDSYEFENLSVSAKAGKVSLSGVLGKDKGEVTINTLNLNLAELIQFLDALNAADLPKVKRGDLQFKGDFRFDKDGFTLSSESLRLSDFELHDDDDKYQVKNVEGPFKVTKDGKGVQIDSDLNVKEFGFDDGETKLTRVSGVLNKLRGVIANDGGTRITLNLSGSDIRLDHEVVTIDGFETLEAPITINVPAGGGYQVKGPVKIGSTTVNVYGRELSDLSGTVDMLVSGPIKSFELDSARLVAGGQAIKVKSGYSLTKKAHTVPDTKIEFPNGMLMARLNIQKGSKRDFKLRLQAKDLSLKEFLSAAKLTEESKDMAGEVEWLDLHVGGHFPNSQKSVEGEGEFIINQGSIRHFNFTRSLKKALRAITPGAVKDDSDSETKKKTTGRVLFKDERIVFEALKLERQGYNFMGTGTLDFDESIAVDGSVVFLQETGEGFGFGVREIGNLIGSVTKIEIPLKIRGAFPDDTSFSIDKAELLKNNSGYVHVERTLKHVGKLGSSVLGVFSSKDKKAEAEKKHAQSEKQKVEGSYALTDPMWFGKSTTFSN